MATLVPQTPNPAAGLALVWTAASPGGDVIRNADGSRLVLTGPLLLLVKNTSGAPIVATWPNTEVVAINIVGGAFALRWGNPDPLYLTVPAGGVAAHNAITREGSVNPDELLTYSATAGVSVAVVNVCRPVN